MMHWLTDPLQYSFVLRALAAAVMVGIVCSVLGTYVVLRGMAFLGDALPHAILPGIVAAYLWELPLALGALVMGVVTAVAIGKISDQELMKEDTAIGVIFAGLFALGVAMLSASGDYSVDLAHFLFGNLLGVSAPDLWVILGLSLLILLLVLLFYKEFLVVSFDPTLAVTLRLPTTFLRYLLLIMLAVTIVVSLQVVGIALMMAMLVTPAAAASLLTRRLPTMMGTAALLGAVSGVVGVYVSFYLDIASGPAVVLVATAVFLLVFLFAPARGVLRRSW
jgi:ABC-type Mn2+/Zn2+ transport system permease subunit